MTSETGSRSDRLGVGSYTYGWATGAYSSQQIASTRTYPYLTAQELIDKAKALRVNVVQICDKPALHELEPEEIDRIGEYARSQGIEIEVGTTGSDHQHLRTYITIAARLNARLVRTLLSNPSDHLERERRELEGIVPLLEKSEISLAIENHERYSCADLSSLLRDIKSDRVGVCLDTVNSLGRGEGISEVIGTLAEHAKCLHVKDFQSLRGESNMGFTITGAIAGRGRLDIRRLIEAYRTACSDGSIILEQWTAFTGDMQESISLQDTWAAEGVEYLRSILEE